MLICVNSACLVGIILMPVRRKKEQVSNMVVESSFIVGKGPNGNPGVHLGGGVGSGIRLPPLPPNSSINVEHVHNLLEKS